MEEKSEKRVIKLKNIPMLIWGEKSDKVIVAVHGNMSNKEDIPIQILAETAIANGWQVISFDLPEHGERKNEPTLCKVQQCVAELDEVMAFARNKWEHIGLFACSIGAYFSLLSYRKADIEKVMFLSPVIDMNLLIENLMSAFGVSSERLEKEQTVATPIGQNLYWDYYCFVCQHPVTIWPHSTYILCAQDDEVVDVSTVKAFAKRFSCTLEFVPNAKHYFYTPQQLNALKSWLERVLK